MHMLLLTSLSSLLLGAVDVVLQLDADLPLVGQVSDERVLEELLCAGSLAVALHQAALYERLELLRPEITHAQKKSCRDTVYFRAVNLIMSELSAYIHG